MKMNELMTIGKLAGQSGVNVETIRFYERKGILKRPKRIGAFRQYSKDYINQIRFIKRSQELGFTLNEVKELINLQVNKDSRCSDVLSKTEDKIREIDQKIKDLKKMKNSLKELAECCIDDDYLLSDCPIFECFTSRKEKI